MCILTFLAIGVTPVVPVYSVTKWKAQAGLNYINDKIDSKKRFRREVDYKLRVLNGSAYYYNGLPRVLNETAYKNLPRVLNETVFNSSNSRSHGDNPGLDLRQINNSQFNTSDIHFTFQVTKPKTFDISVEKTTQVNAIFPTDKVENAHSLKLSNDSTTPKDEKTIKFDNIKLQQYRRTGRHKRRQYSHGRKMKGQKYERSIALKQDGEEQNKRTSYPEKDNTEDEIGLEIPDSVYVRDELLSHFQMNPYIKRTHGEESSMQDFHKIENNSDDKMDLRMKRPENKILTDHHIGRNHATEKYNYVRQNKEGREKDKRMKKRQRKTTAYVDEEQPTRFFKEITTSAQRITTLGSRFSVISNKNKNYSDTDKKKQTRSHKRVKVPSRVRKPISAVTELADSTRNAEVDIRNSKKSRLAALKKKIDDLESKMSKLLSQIKSKYKLILKSASNDIRNHKNKNKEIEFNEKTSNPYDSYQSHEREIERQAFKGKERDIKDKGGNIKNMNIIELLLDVAKHTIMDWRGPINDEAKIKEWRKDVNKKKTEKSSSADLSKMFSNIVNTNNKSKGKSDKLNSLDQGNRHRKPKKHEKYKKDEDEIIAVRDGIYEEKILK